MWLCSAGRAPLCAASLWFDPDSSTIVSVYEKLTSECTFCEVLLFKNLDQAEN